ncbi:hypothetical protein ACAG26_10050 [Mycobacterium sp. pUA109]|uniref:hypothetical protein n=1 Tax=Mycobacterium sp. pUA109 TaxID=3238982 RepID=UPI00351BE8D3
MNAVNGAVSKLGRAAGRAATMTTEAAGAIGGAAVNGVVGAVTGAAAGVQRGIGSGSHSTPAAALTLGALGVVGLVEWPVLLTVGGAALLLRQLNRRPDDAAPAQTAPAKTTAKAPAKRAAAPAKATKSTNSQRPRQSGRAKSPATRRPRASK